MLVMSFEYPHLGAAREEGRRVPDRWSQRIDRSIIHNDSELMVIDKPTGLAVHGGSGVSSGSLNRCGRCFQTNATWSLFIGLIEIHRFGHDCETRVGPAGTSCITAR